MSAGDVFMSFFLSLGTNIVVLMGISAYFYWLGFGSQASGVVNFRRPLVLITSAIVLGFIQTQAWMNTTLAPNAFGMHWSFLNDTLIVIFFLNLAVRDWTETILLNFMMLTYFLRNIEVMRAESLIAMAIFEAILVLTRLYPDQFTKSRWKLYGGLTVIGISGFAMVYLVTSASGKDVWFWVRQFGAFAVLSLTSGEFNLAFYRQKEQAENLKINATVDELTGLLNFASFNMALEGLFQRFQKDGSVYSVYELDVDTFKGINDNFGHLAGNVVLTEIANTLVAYAHNVHAKVYRMGGEEFALVVVGSTAIDVERRVAARLQQLIADLRFNDISPSLRVSVSIGQDTVKPTDTDYLGVYTAADQSLYLSKRSGRSRATIHGELQDDDRTVVNRRKIE